MYNCNPFAHKASFAILDYSRPNETFNLLNSLRFNTKLQIPIICLINGARSENEFEYAFNAYKSGLIDELIVMKQGLGGGIGHCDLFRWCRTPYMFFLQSDHELVRNITEESLDYFIDLIENKNFKYVDLSGNQGDGKYSDRANFWKVEDFNKLEIEKHAGGGPGILTARRWNENYLQQKQEEEKWSIAHISPLFFADMGKTSVREYADGGKTLHYTDTKQLFILNSLKEKNSWIDASDQEWELIFTGKWKNGDILEKDKKNSFILW